MPNSSYLTAASRLMWTKCNKARWNIRPISLMQSAITQPQDATYQQLGEGGGGRENPLVAMFLLNAPPFLFYPPLTFLTLLPSRNIFLFFFLNTNQTLKCLSLTHTHNKNDPFLHLWRFYFFTFIWLFVIRLRFVFGRLDNGTVNLSHGAQQSKEESVFQHRMVLLLLWG